MLGNQPHLVGVAEALIILVEHESDLLGPPERHLGPQRRWKFVAHAPNRGAGDGKLFSLLAAPRNVVDVEAHAAEHLHGVQLALWRKLDGDS